MAGRKLISDMRELPFGYAPDRSVVDRLVRDQENLEREVEPFVTTKPSRFIVEFKGKKRFLKDDVPIEVWGVMGNLQYLYQLFDALKCGEYDRLIGIAMSYGASRHERTMIKFYGISSLDAITYRKRMKEKNQKVGYNSTKGKSPEEQMLLQVAYSRHKGKKNWLELTTNELRRLLPAGKSMSAPTVSRRLRELGLT